MDASSLRLAVLNPGGRDREQAFPDFAGAPDFYEKSGAHPPVNYHAYAACTGGSFHRDAAAIPTGSENVLLLLRQRALPLCFTLLNKLKTAGKTVAVSLKESGQHQVADLLAARGNFALFQKICAAADGALSSTQWLAPIYEAAGARRAEFIPTPYPVEDARWDFSAPDAERRGIFLGTREWDVPSRNHAAALLLAHALAERAGCDLTMMACSSRLRERRLLAGLHPAANLPRLRIVRGPLSYPAYLRLMARHAIVFQLDRSAVPGQVAGDALLARVPCIGGDGAIERLAFENESGHGRDPSGLRDLAAKMLADPAARAHAIARAQAAAREALSFPAAAARLERFYGEISRA